MNGQTHSIQLSAGVRYLLITTMTGYGIPSGKGNMYLLGTSGNYAAVTRMTNANTEAITVDVSDKVNLKLADVSGYSRYWLYALS